MHNTSYNTNDLLSSVQNNISKLTSEQKHIYDKIIHYVDNNVGEIFFLNAPEGTGKTFSDKIDSGINLIKNDIVLAIAVGKPDNVFICSDNWTAKNVVYLQVLRS